MRLAPVLPAVAALVLAGAAGLEPGVEIRTTGGRLQVRAEAAPLAEVIDRLARQTGMKVIYEGLPPRQLITVTLKGRTPAEAVLGILEGQGLNYAVVMDAGGTRVETLMMTAAAPGSAASAGAAASAPAPQPPPPVPPEPQDEPGVNGGENDPILSPPPVKGAQPPASEAQPTPTPAPPATMPGLLPGSSGFLSPFAPQPASPLLPPGTQPSPAPSPPPDGGDKR